MIQQQKIINDPVYGFISIPSAPVFTLLEHPWFQRLRRIKQLGLTHYVYPGAIHTRFHHALGAMHLMQEALAVLQRKGVPISTEEEQAALISILLHDIGHGPYSHALEYVLADLDHESITEFIMRQLNDEMKGELSLAIEIFAGRYPREFLHQLVSSQMDMDRMDYLKRDSFFTGVAEGVIGHDRIIKMLNVVDGKIVLEEKALYSIEKFLVARRLMYLQVYLHKTVLSAEHMLKRLLQRAGMIMRNSPIPGMPSPLSVFLKDHPGREQLLTAPGEFLDKFAVIDDIDVGFAVKILTKHEDPVLKILSDGLINRRLFKTKLSDEPFLKEEIDNIAQNIVDENICSPDLAHELIFTGKESAGEYITGKEDILILMKSSEVRPLAEIMDFDLQKRQTEKYFVCHPKFGKQ